MTVKLVELWEDSKGNFYKTKREAELAEEKYADNEELLMVVAALKKHTKTMPKTTKEAAKIVRDAFKDLKKVLDK